MKKRVVQSPSLGHDTRRRRPRRLPLHLPSLSRPNRASQGWGVTHCARGRVQSMRALARDPTTYSYSSSSSSGYSAGDARSCNPLQIYVQLLCQQCLRSHRCYYCSTQLCILTLPRHRLAYHGRLQLAEGKADTTLEFSRRTPLQPTPSPRNA